MKVKALLAIAAAMSLAACAAPEAHQHDHGHRHEHNHDPAVHTIMMPVFNHSAAKTVCLYKSAT